MKKIAYVSHEALQGFMPQESKVFDENQALCVVLYIEIQVTDLWYNCVHVSCSDRLMRSVLVPTAYSRLGLDPSRKYPLTRSRSMSGKISGPVRIVTEQATCTELGKLTQS